MRLGKRFATSRERSWRRGIGDHEGERPRDSGDAFGDGGSTSLPEDGGPASALPRVGGARARLRSALDAAVRRVVREHDARGDCDAFCLLPRDRGRQRRLRIAVRAMGPAASRVRVPRDRRGTRRPPRPADPPALLGLLPESLCAPGGPSVGLRRSEAGSRGAGRGSADLPHGGDAAGAERGGGAARASPRRLGGESVCGQRPRGCPRSARRALRAPTRPGGACVRALGRGEAVCR